MKVFKFGGASVKDAEAVRNVAKIVENYKDDQLMIVVSAMGKTTNAFEVLAESFYYKSGNLNEQLVAIKHYHFEIAEELFEDPKHPVFQELENTFVEAEWQLEDDPVGTFDFEYDQLVSIGEQLSTRIVEAYLKKSGINSTWLDARDLIRTDNTYRKANIDWELTTQFIQDKIKRNSKFNVFVSQGFIGSTSENFTSTLGREGSDFSAAIFASSLAAEEVVIWKDVPGMLNADPKYFEDTVVLENISYKEAVELAYYGASVIHPKTIKPLQNKNIPLKVKSFINHDLPGSLIDNNDKVDSLIPSYIHKPSQILLSISSKDYAFMDEFKLSEVFQFFHEFNVSINIMQNSAISFSVCADHDQKKCEKLISKLIEKFKVTYNTNLTLLTVRHYNADTIEKLIHQKEILLQQKSRSTARFVVR